MRQGLSQNFCRPDCCRSVSSLPHLARRGESPDAFIGMVRPLFEGALLKGATMTKSTPKTYRASDGDIFGLFCTGGMEHVCDLIKDSNDPAPKGWRTDLAGSLTTKLLPFVELMIDRLHESGRGYNAAEFDATNAFRICIENVAQSLAMSEGGTNGSNYSNDETKKLADDLCNAWTKFIAYAAAHRMYDDLPRELVKAKNRSKQASVNASNPHKSVTKDELEKYRHNFTIKNGTYRGWKKAACIEYKITIKTLNKRMKE